MTGQVIHVNTLSNKRNCAECLNKVNAKSNRNGHLLAHRRERTDKCSECEKSFGQSGDLKKHMTTHSMKKNFTCIQCQRSFGQAGHLKNHMLTHSGEKQGCISCGTCSYPELTEDHVLTSAYVKFFRIVTRNAVNKSF